MGRQVRTNMQFAYQYLCLPCLAGFVCFLDAVTLDRIFKPQYFDRSHFVT